MPSLDSKKPYIEVMAMVIGQQPIGENDRRVVLLTKEMGKISAFARGARRPNSALVASTDLFCFGTFRMYSGRDSYTLVEAQIQNYFPYFRTNIEGALWGQYFCEVLEYITRENNDESMLLLLMYQTLRALEAEQIPNKLVRSIFEIKTVVIEGEFPGLPNPQKYSPAAIRAVEYIAGSTVAKVFNFQLEEGPMKELSYLASAYLDRSFHLKCRALQVLDDMGFA